MRRIKVMLAVVAAVATMMVMAAPAMAQGFWGDPWANRWANPIDVNRITDVDPGRNGLELEGEGTFWGVPAQFEWVCDFWGFNCVLTDVDRL